MKFNKAKNIRNKLNLEGLYLANYQHHENGRNLVEWNNNKIDVKHMKSTSHMVHYGVYDKNGDFKFWLIAIHTLNKLDQKRIMWRDIEGLCGKK